MIKLHEHVTLSQVIISVDVISLTGMNQIIDYRINFPFNYLNCRSVFINEIFTLDVEFIWSLFRYSFLLG